jgi:hypothetical protein
MSKQMHIPVSKHQSQTPPPPITICKDCIHGLELFDCEQQTRKVVHFGPAHDIRFAVLSCSGYVKQVTQPEKESA